VIKIRLAIVSTSMKAKKQQGSERCISKTSWNPLWKRPFTDNRKLRTDKTWGNVHTPSAAQCLLSLSVINQWHHGRYGETFYLFLEAEVLGLVSSGLGLQYRLHIGYWSADKPFSFYISVAFVPHPTLVGLVGKHYDIAPGSTFSGLMLISHKAREGFYFSFFLNYTSRKFAQMHFSTR